MQKLTEQIVIERCKEALGDNYSFHDFKYVNCKVKAKVFCNKHQETFEALPSNLMQGCGCVKCAEENRKVKKTYTNDEVKSLIVSKHGDKYSFDRLNYTSCYEPMEIFCTDCKMYFMATITQMVSRSGCQRCATKRRGFSRRNCAAKFKEDSINRYGEKFDHSEVVYKTRHDKVVLTCLTHNLKFEVRPATHLAKTSSGGCSECCNHGYRYHIPGILYVLQCGGLTKVGITNKDVKDRVKRVSKSYGNNFEVLRTYNFSNGEDACNLETILLQELRSYNKRPTKKFEGSSECFYDVDLQNLFKRIEDSDYYKNSGSLHEQL